MKKLTTRWLLLCAFLAVAACKKDHPAASKTVSLQLPATTDAYYPYKKIVVSNQNEKATLGRVLFYDAHLSLNNAVSCGSCHKQALAFADNIAFSRGFENKLTARNSMALENLVFANGTLFSLSMVNDTRLGVSDLGTQLFWDGREVNLQNLIARPLTNHVEMGIGDVEALAKKLAALSYYPDLFKKAYGDEQVTFDRVSECIAFFITAIKSSDTRYDDYRRDKGSLSALEQEGLLLFDQKYNCAGCHRVDSNGYTGSVFADIGLPAANGDKGMGGFTGLASGMNVFKVPNLRNVALTAPYMHDGRFRSLHEVLDHYSNGIENTPNLTEILKDEKGMPLKMNIPENEKQALIAFLNTLTDYNMVTDKKFSDPFIIK